MPMYKMSQTACCGGRCQLVRSYSALKSISVSDHINVSFLSLFSALSCQRLGLDRRRFPISCSAQIPHFDVTLPDFTYFYRI